MRFQFPLVGSQLGGVHLVVFQKFQVPYEIEIVGNTVVYVLSDDLPAVMIYDIGMSVGMLGKALEDVFGDQVWPIDKRGGNY